LLEYITSPKNTMAEQPPIILVYKFENVHPSSNCSSLKILKLTDLA